VVSGSGALVVLAVLVVGVPLGLAATVGWPLPHHVPTLAGLRTALTTRGIPNQTLLDALACVAWLAWASAVLSIAEETVAAIKGRGARRIPIAGAFQPVASRLVAAVLFATLALGRPQPTAPSPARAPLALQLHPETTTLTAFVVGAPPQPSPADGTPPVNPSTGADTLVTYTVVRHDTLWSIAQNQLGDPLLWRQIFVLNESRPQPDGRSLTDPSWIYPGWILILPSVSNPSPAAAPPISTPITLPAKASTLPMATPSPAASSPAKNLPHPPTPPSGRSAVGNGKLTKHTNTTGAPVRLPSGSVVAGSFAAGVLSAVAIGRLRRRHAYSYRPPASGRDLTPEPLRPTLRRLAHPFDADADHEDTDDPESIPAAPFDDIECRQDPGYLELGARNGATVTVEITDLSDLSLCGPATHDIARALLASLLVRAGPGAVEALLTATLADQLLPGLGTNRGLRRAKTADDLIRAVEGETIARTRRLDAAEAPDAASFRNANPENPLPLLLVIVDDVPDVSLGRWAALVGGSARLGIAMVSIGERQAATGRLCTDASRTVTHAEPPSLAERLVGAQLFGLRGDEAVEVLDTVAENDDDSDDKLAYVLVDQTITAQRSIEVASDESPPPVPDGEPWPEPFLADGGQDRPIVVQMFGPFRITVHGEAVTTGLRSRAKALFAWYLVHPEGASSDEAVDALWPDTTAERVGKQFWRAFGDLRARFRGPSDVALDVLTKSGEHYQPCSTEIACDLWEFQAALGDAARATDEDHARVALHRASHTYRGELLQGTDYLWVEPVRQDLHRRALDAHLRLAELEDHAGRPEVAVTTLERAIDLDRYAEEPYRRLMALHAAHGRLDAVTATWKLLHRRLADLDLDLEPTTSRLYRALTAGDATEDARPIRVSS
jgi:DNA-binding SARP family transcriptional activator